MKKKKNGHSGVAPPQIEQREGKHAAQLGETIFAPFFPGMHEDFGVGLRGEAMAAADEAFTQLSIVIQFAVKNYRDIASFVPNGLVAAGQVDDGQAAHAQSETGYAWFVHDEALAVGTTMRHGGGHHAHTRAGVVIRSSKGRAANSAHAIFLSQEETKR